MARDEHNPDSVIVSYNPATGEKLGEVSEFSAEQAKEAISRAALAQKKWEAAGIEHRSRWLMRFRDTLLERADEVCRLIAMENGKPLQEALSFEVIPIIDLATYFAKRASKILAPQKIPLHLMKQRRSYVHYRPRGVVLVISPWNFPFAIPSGEILMALVAGNAVVQKPASLTPLIALKMRELCLDSGLDPDLFQVITGPGVLGSQMIEMGVHYVNFTGSTAVGRKVAAACGREMIPCTMELGGKDPAIICEDADLEYAAGSVVWGAFANSGQVCVSIERAYVHRSVYDRFVKLVVEKTKALRQGNPLGDVDIGAMTDGAQIEVIERQVAAAVEAGAKILTGGKRLDGPGQFYPPTVLVDTTGEMAVVAEESFGPLLPIMPFDTEQEAIACANDSIYGLNADVYTRDRARGRKIAEQIEAGTVMVNECLITHACPETPWGGVKQSGMGRVHSDDGLRSLCEAYHVNEESFPLPLSRSPFWHPYSHDMYRKLLQVARSVFGRTLGDKARSIGDVFTK